jgi:hypothetical protein
LGQGFPGDFRKRDFRKKDFKKGDQGKGTREKGPEKRGLGNKKALKATEAIGRQGQGQEKNEGKEAILEASPFESEE